ncbi:hypothetical protein [Tropicimonas sediminicola]|uniref:hypothetical protein n=1 Tax=Tropicimonas sediminicola TaxID=1031541 RepID=UPI0011323C03|nr:hypothetical protein [Tropicimonas sediminicola]
MSKNGIALRNKANAQKSTGPRTAQGRAIVSGNARKHGATARADPTSVAAWARIILNNPDLDPGDILKGDKRVAAAMALAEAEVRLCSAQAALDEFELGSRQVPDALYDLQESAENIMSELRLAKVTERELRERFNLIRRIHKNAIAETGSGGRRHRLLQRYVREARGHRKRAFQTWLANLAQADDLAEKVA